MPCVISGVLDRVGGAVTCLQPGKRHRSIFLLLSVLSTLPLGQTSAAQNGFVELQKITADDSGEFDRFGQTLDIERVFMAIGAPLHDGSDTDTGAVYTFVDAGPLGWSFGVIVRGEPKAHVRLILSNRRHWIELPNIDGPPLVAVPGGFFSQVDAGLIPPDGSLKIPISLDNDPALRGLALTAQAWVEVSNRTVLTNAATRIVAE